MLADPQHSLSSVVDLLSRRSQEQPQRQLYTFLEESGGETGVTYGALDSCARRIAAVLEDSSDARAPVLLLYPPGLEYIAAFFGCLYAGRVAVPAYPPDPARLGRTLPRLVAMVQDAQVSVVLTTSFIASASGMLLAEAPELQSVRWVPTDQIEEGAGNNWNAPRIRSDALAFLQYTSGSTGAPRAVMLSHGNLLHNLNLITRSFETRSDSVAVIWLPPYHDMGLIGGILTPLYGGFAATLMSPFTFLRRPLKWLQTISDFKGTISGGPNFAYDLCVRKISAEQRQTLDLSHWEVAFCGAEPVRPDTIARFCETFASCGFEADAFRPCYGLAEATLLVSASKKRGIPVVRRFGSKGLALGQAIPNEDKRAHALAGCGQTLPGQEIRIVDPTTSIPCLPGTIGEIWVAGSSVAQGYWARRDETELTFGALASGDSETTFLRTGDLGFFHDEELFISGRLKDLIIVRGRNLYPQDLERTVEQSHPALRPGCSAAFAIDVDGEERLIVVQEVDPTRLASPVEPAALVRQRLADTHEVHLHTLVLIEPGTIPKTSSGKIQRHAARADFLAGALRTVWAWSDDSHIPPEVDAVTATTPLAENATVEEIRCWLRIRIARTLRVAVESLDVAEPITSRGLDSLSATELGCVIESEAGVPVQLETLLRGPTTVELAERIALHRQASGIHRRAPIPRRPPGLPTLVSPAQERLWFLDQLEPGSARHNIPVAIRLTGVLDPAALERSFQEVIRRHQPLRTTLQASEDGAVLVVAPDLPFTVVQLDLRALPPEAREQEVLRRAEEQALLPFDLARGPLLRAVLLEIQDSEHVLLLTIHHTVCDGWSMGILARELGSFYMADLAGRAALLPELPIDYSDYAAWRREKLRSESYERDLAYWREQLEGVPERVDLAVARASAGPRSRQGASVDVLLSAELLEAIKALSRREEVTPFVVLLAAFQLLLSRYSGQEDICVSAPSAGRDRAETRGLIGFFVNTLILRTHFNGVRTFRELLVRVRDATLEAHSHQDVPFEKVVEALRPAGQAGFSPPFHLAIQPDPSTALELPGIEVRRLAVPSGVAQFELTLALSETAQGLSGQLQYAVDLLDAATAARLVAHLRSLLENAVAHPAQPLATLSMISAEERRQLLVEWGTGPGDPPDLCAHRLFEQQVARTPDAVAVSYEGTELRYSELNRRANQLARVLRRHGVGPEVLVGLCVDRSAEMVLGILGVLKAGGAYVPLDPTLPRERLAFLVDDARPALVLSQRSLIERLGPWRGKVLCWDDLGEELSDELSDDFDGGAGSRNLAYVIYTSGSTGKPKGTLLEHRGLCNTALETSAAMALGPSDRLLQFFAFSFDAAVSDFFPALLSGAELCLARPEWLLPGPLLEQTLREHAITAVSLTPSVLAHLDPERLPELRTVISCGEACTTTLAERWSRGRRFLNAYGPTEVTVCATIERDLDPECPALGKPLANVQVYVLNEGLEPVPVGVPGELCVAGVGLARAYLGRPDMTADRFVPNPFSNEQGARLYRTGDRVRYIHDGRLEFLGRLDNQIKLRGFRIELGEVEEELRALAGVRDAAVVLREDAPGEERLIGYVVTSADVARELRGLLAERLPNYMIPSVFVVMEDLPRTHHGKLDRNSLPAPDGTRGASKQAFVLPRTVHERRLAGIWGEVLRIEGIGAHDNFFDLGGHSLMATQVVSRVRRAFGVELPLGALFEAPTLEVLANRIAESPRATLTAQPLVPVPRSEALPISLAQERLWLFDRISPGSPTYNVPVAVRLRGALDVPTLQRSLMEIVRRHEALRTVFREVDGLPTQVILPPGSVTLPLLLLVDMPRSEVEARARQLVHEEAAYSFDLERGPLLRMLLIRLGADDHVLCLVLHHIVSDGWSAGVFLRELAGLYGAFRRGEPSPFPEPVLQYADYSVWHRRSLESGLLEEHLSYWRRQLAGISPLRFPADVPRPQRERFFGDVRRFRLDRDLVAPLEALARHEGTTLFMALLAAFDVLLHRHTGQEDVAVGTDVANRGHEELEALIGFFTNQLVIRTDMSGDPDFKALLARVRRVTMEAYEHQDMPFGRLVQEMRTERATTGQPLFQAKLVLENAPMPALSLPDLTLELMDPGSNGTARWDLLLIFAPSDGGLSVTAEYSTDVFDGDAITRLWDHFVLLVRAVLETPDRRISTLPMLTRREQHLLDEWSTTEDRAPPSTSLQFLFERVVAAAPESVALVAEDQTLTYDELNRRANQVAHYLLSKGVGPATRVALCLERSVDLVVGLLGIVKAGGSYVPLDASYPTERLAYIIGDAKPALILTHSDLADGLPTSWLQVLSLDLAAEALAGQADINPPDRTEPDGEVYVLYTSGSAGTPKGVAIPQRGILRLVCQPGYARLTADETLLQFAPVTFDASTFELWGALLNGAKLVIAPPGTLSLDDLGQLVRRRGITTLWLTAGLFHQLVDSNLGALASVRQLLAGGDVLSPPHVAMVLDAHPDCQVINGYGPTENTTFTACFAVKNRNQIRGTVPIGAPIAGTRIRLLNAALQAVPLGAPGELYAAGEGLAHGYLNDAALTAERFIPDPFSGSPGARLYRTGDLCRYRSDGSLEFIGRIDNQVKMRGYRIEPGEIETALRRHHAIQDAAVAVHDIAGSASLVAHVVLNGGRALAVEELQQFVRERLPNFMVPVALQILDELPLTANGKVDRRALRAPGAERPQLGTAYQAPQTSDEQVLAAIAADVLGVELVGIDDNFFELGGDSIRAIQFVARATRQGLKISVANLLEKQTIRATAALQKQNVAPERELAPVAPLSLVSPADKERLPLTAEDAYPLALLQAGMLFESEFSGRAALYQDAFSFHLELELDVAVFRRVLMAMVARHAALRTSFDLLHYEANLQIVHSAVETPLEFEDLSNLQAAEQDAFLESWLEAERSRPFQWDHAPLIRFALHRRTDRTAQFSVVFHHAILDGWSFASFLAELFPRYLAALRGDGHSSGPLPTSYRDFVALEQQALNSEETGRYWRERLEAVTRSSASEVGNRRQSAEQADLLFYEADVPAPITQGLRALARDASVPLKSVLLAAHLRVCSVVEGNPEVVTGFVVNGRPETDQAEQVLGLFLNTLPFCLELSGGSWLDLARAAFALERELMPHRRYPMARLQQELGGQPLFSTVFNFVHFHVSAGLAGIEGMKLVEPYREHSWLDFALDTTFTVDPTSQALKVTLRSNVQRGSIAQLERMVGFYLRALEEMAVRPQGRYELLSLVGEDERRRLLSEWNDSESALAPNATVCSMFEAQVARTPDQLAVEWGGDSLRYRDLNARANQLAHYLRNLGVGSEARVALALPRSLDMVVAVLGVLKAGAAYVPLDPSYPLDAVAYVVENSAATAVIGNASLLKRLPETARLRICLDEIDLSREETQSPCVNLDAAHLAYILYTSGSTGRPKGVLVTHGGLANYLAWSGETYAPAEGIGTPVHSPFGFDLTITSLLTPLVSGGRLLLVPEGRGGEDLADMLQVGRDYSLVKITPSQLGLLELQMRDVEFDGRVRCFVVGGEALTATTLAAWRERAPDTRIINEYGPTETVVGCCVYEVKPDDPLEGAVPIGRPIANTQLYVLDAHFTPAPIGAPGELYVGGAGVARGYANCPHLTAERFVPDAFAGRPGQRLYRTGDVVRWRADGQLEFLGRTDEQVKIRGFRIELGEVTAVLTDHPAVLEAAVVVREDDGVRRLVGYFVAAGEPPTPGELKSYLGTTLPEHMVPAHFVALESLPVTRNGKLDRKALPAPEVRLAVEEVTYVGPRTPVEERLVTIFGQVLRVARVGIHDSFYDLGGDSLLATQIIVRVRDAFRVELPVRELFDALTVANLAEKVEHARASRRAPEGARLVPIPRDGELPLSFAQERLWFLDQFDPGSASYNVPMAVSIDGDLHVEALERSFDELVRRHEPLRTTFRSKEGRPVQSIAPASKTPLRLIDVRRLPVAQRVAEAQRAAADAAESPFDLEQGPLLRVLIVRLDANEHLLLVTMHHIVSDGWSTGVLVREIAALYGAFVANKASPLGELPIQYVDYASWQRQWLGGTALDAALAYWRTTLAGATPLLELPTDRPRPAVRRYQGASHRLTLPKDLSEALKALAQREGATPFMLLLAAFQLLLSQLSGQEDVCVGSPIAGRSHTELEGLIGLFVNTLVLRTSCNGDPTFRQLLGRVRQTTLTAYANQDVPFEKLVEHLAPERSLSHAPLFQVAFALQNAPAAPLSLPGLVLREQATESRTSKFDLSLSLKDGRDGFEGTLEYAVELFEASSIARIAEQLRLLLEEIVRDPDRPISHMTFLGTQRRSRPVKDYVPTPAPAGRALVHDLFAQQVVRAPHALAILDGQRRATYSEVDGMARMLAARLRRLGVSCETPVAIVLDRSIELVVAKLAVLRAGGAVVPFDPVFPQRLCLLVSDARVAAVLTRRCFAHLLPVGAPHVLMDDLAHGGSSDDEPFEAVTAEHLAYVVYTSGSTGSPKGVALEHGALSHLVDWHLADLPIGREDRGAVLASPAFDASMLEIWPKLAAGATIVIAPEEARIDGAILARWIADQGITIVFLPTALGELFLAEPLPAHHRLRLVLVGGEPLKRRPSPQASYALINMYGPTEGTVLATRDRVAPAGTEAGLPAIGRPISGMRVDVLDEQWSAVPSGSVGELVLAGAGIARGYLHRPELTAERFLPDPLGPAGARAYRTGDLARVRPDGRLECLGRLDGQVKLRGFRIELGEIEAALALHPGVREAAVVVAESHGNQQLVAVVTSRGQGGQAASARELDAHLRALLPTYMLPARYAYVDALPLTPNGKIDRKALPPPEAKEAVPSEGYVAPRTPTEEIIAGLFADILGLQRVGAKDSFFDLGGHSLLATQTMSRLRSSLGAELPVRELFQAPTPEQLAMRVETTARTGRGPEGPALVPVPRVDLLPLSFAQQRLWFLDRLRPGVALYNLCQALRLEGRLDSAALRRSLEEIVRRHEVFRTTFRTEGGLPYQAVSVSQGLSFESIQIEADPEQREHIVEKRLADEARRPFDLANGPLFRVVLFSLADDQHVLALAMHHIVADGWSFGVLGREVSTLYEAFRQGQPSPLEPLLIQYADYAVWQRRWLEAGAFDAQLAYWKGHLATAPRTLDLPTDRPRPLVQTYEGASHRMRWSPELWQRLVAVSRSAGVTPFMTLLAAFQILLGRYSGLDDVCVGSPIAGRTRGETEKLIGFFVNTIVLRTSLAGNPTFRDVLDRVRSVTLDAYAYQDVPFEKVVAALQPDRDLSRSPLFEVMFALQNTPMPLAALPELMVTPVHPDVSSARFDLTLTLFEADGALSGALEYNTHLFDAATVRRMEAHLLGLLNTLLVDPDRRLSSVSLLSEGERQEMEVHWNKSAVPFPTDVCFHDLFTAQAKRTPNATAVTFQGHCLSYRELDRRANRFARRLRELGVGPEVPVGLCADRSLELLIALLGLLKAGGAYVPLDPAYPRERLAFMLSDSGARLLLIQPHLAAHLTAPGVAVHLVAPDVGEEGAEQLDSESWTGLDTENLAYVIYTSGSTGRPKGALLTHRGLCNTALAAVKEHGFHADSRVLQFATIGFDASVCEITATLLAGGTLCLAPREALLPGPPLRATLENDAITAVTLTPSVLAQLDPEGLPALGTVISAGEPCTPDVAKRWSRGRKLLNAYGPTEVTVCASINCSLDPDSPTIGRPFPNVRVYVLDKHLVPTPVGVIGELYVGGPGVGRGYANRPDLTAERFVPDPFAADGQRLYRTGDRVRWRGNGELDYVGRADSQVKLRGARIELGEIEAVLARHPGVQGTSVMLREVGGIQKLVAYVVGGGPQAPTASELRRHLLTTLPEHMVPAAFVPLGALPLTPNGKVDRNALPAPDVNHLGVGTYTAPRSHLEQAVASIWQEVLKVPRVGLHDGFFELGGNSLSLVQIHSRLVSQLGREIPLVELFQYRTVGALAAHLSRTTMAAEPTKTDDKHFGTRRGIASKQRVERRQRLQRESATSDDGSSDENE